MTRKTKALTMALCAVLLVVTTVFATMAFLTSQDSVTNTFTVGEISLTLDEKDTDGSKTDTTTDGRDKANEYHLLPSSTYEKDPTVHVAANSEDCYVYVKVTNGIAEVEATTGNYDDVEYKSISDQIKTLGWKQLVVDGKEVVGVYYQTVSKAKYIQELVVFKEFKIKGDVSNEELAKYATKTDDTKIIEVVAYAVQSAGFDDAADAWSNTFGN
ncbi:MAG: hypothetical protein IJ439_04505 [Tyzzerella sp.]|nr:hypothetical protein [Tyzzerella sp.]